MIDEQKFNKIIEDSENENNGYIIHRYIQKKTNHLSNLTELTDIFETIIKTSLFVACREFIRLHDICNSAEEKRNASLAEKNASLAEKNAFFDEKENVLLAKTENAASEEKENSSLREKLSQIAQQLLVPKIKEYLQTKNLRRCKEALLTAYAIGNEELCREFLQSVNNPSAYIYSVYKSYQFDEDLDAYLCDLMIFLLKVTKDLDDVTASACVRSLKFDQPKLYEEFMEKKEKEIHALSNHYYRRDMYLSLSSLLGILEKPSDDNTSRKLAYEYVGVGREEFLAATLEKGTASSLELYLWVKFGKSVPPLKETKEILLRFRNSQAVYSIVMQCMRMISEQGRMAKDVREILIWIRDNLRSRELDYNILDAYEDAGINIGKLDYYVVRNFQILCKNEEDIAEYMKSISYFNLYGNAELRLDIDIAGNKQVANSDWQREYDYICKRYKYKPGTILSIVMNSYLKLFVDIFDLIPRCESEISRYWFLGYMTNNSQIKIIQERNNPNIEENSYRVTIERFIFTEQLQYVRFHISGIKDCIDQDKENGANPNAAVPNSKKIIKVYDVQSIFTQYKKIIEKYVYALLMNEKIELAYKYLKTFENKEKNIWSRDRYVSIQTGRYSGENAEDEIVRIINSSDRKLGGKLQYIYLNSSLKRVISPARIAWIFDENCYLLANITPFDNPDFEDCDYFYIRPNYYSDTELLLKVKKSLIPKELKAFIADELRFGERKNKDKNQYKKERSESSFIRVCFTAKWNELELGQVKSEDDDFVTGLYLHCCESRIDGLASAISTYYNRIQKSSRQGINRNLLVKYIGKHNNFLKENLDNGGEQFHYFLNSYFYFLHKDIEAIITDENNRGRWFYKGQEQNYYDINLFVMLDDIKTGKSLFDDSYYDNEKFRSFVLENSYYKKIMGCLNGCEDWIRKFVYEKTIIKYLNEDKL